MKLTTIALLTTALLQSCTIGSDGIVDSDKNKWIACTDTRDGEQFRFNTNNITNARIGFGVPHSFDVVDDTGKLRHLNDAMASFLKCEDE